MVVFDASFLIDLFNPRIKGDRRHKIDHLIATLTKKKHKALVPTPALTELMARAGNARDGYYQKINQSGCFKIVPFGSRAAMECALLLDEAKSNGDRKNEGKTWAKAKFDWQIAAIAKAEGATTIYSEDGDLARMANRMHLSCVKIDDLPLPDSARQGNLAFEDSSQSEPVSDV